jgi:hypothetical protein
VKTRALPKGAGTLCPMVRSWPSILQVTRVLGAPLALAVGLLWLGACSTDDREPTDPCARSATAIHTGEITEPVPLLHDDGSLAAHGWARAPHMQYDRARIDPERRAALREWDYYAVYADGYSFSFTLANLGLFAFAIPTVEDYATGDVHSALLLADSQLLDLPPTPFGDTLFDTSSGSFEYRFDEDARLIDVVTPDYEAHLRLEDRRDIDSIAVAHRFDDSCQFFYENKRLPMPATGSVQVGDLTYELPEQGAFGVLDWGRGVWPSMIRWEWAHFVGTTDGHTVGVNLGTVFADDAAGTADALFVDGVLHKLERVQWSYDRARVMDPWQFTSDDGRIALVLTPDFDDPLLLSLGPAYRIERSKVHGRITGTAQLDDGSTLLIDALPGSAEHVEITW